MVSGHREPGQERGVRRRSWTVQWRERPAGSRFWHHRWGEVKARLTNRGTAEISLFEAFQRAAEVGLGHRGAQAARQAASVRGVEDAGVRKGRLRDGIEIELHQRTLA